MSILKTKRLLLHPVSISDAPFLLQLLNTPKWKQYIGDRNVHTIKEMEQYIIHKILPMTAVAGKSNYVIKSVEMNADIGICGLYKRDYLDAPDIGFAFLPEHEQKGFGYEAASAVMRHAFIKLRLRRIYAITLTDNIPSQKLIEKLGMAFQKIVQNDEKEGLKLYGLTRGEYLERCSQPHQPQRT